MLFPPFYWILCCGSEVYAYLNNVRTVSEVIDNIEAVRRAAPEISFKIECYHEESSTSTDSDGRETTSTSYVTTFRAN